jgi:hypothetical protein
MALTMEAVRTSERCLFCDTTWRYIPERCRLHGHVFLQNIRFHLQDYMASEPIQPQTIFSPPSNPQVTLYVCLSKCHHPPSSPRELPLVSARGSRNTCA